jgi:hypothetical protein
MSLYLILLTEDYDPSCVQQHCSVACVGWDHLSRWLSNVCSVGFFVPMAVVLVEGVAVPPAQGAKCGGHGAGLAAAWDDVDLRPLSSLRDPSF